MVALFLPIFNTFRIRNNIVGWDFFTWFSLLHHFIYKSTCICWICGYYADLLMEECLIYISLIIILSEYSSRTHVLVRYIVIETFLIVRIFQIYTEMISINTFKCNILLSLSLYNPLRLREVNWYLFGPVLWLW